MIANGNMMKINKVLQIILILILPFILLIGAIRLITTPGFAAFEYNHSWFTPDPYGMTKQERLRWSEYAIKYLTNDAGISYLGDLRFDDGSEVFNERELGHMVDVKQVMKTSFTVWYALLGFAFAVMVWFIVMHEWKIFSQALTWGAWVTIGLIAAVLFFLAISFNQLFERFHQLFFADGSWVFYQSDTLIRLFPIEFWRDAFILVCVLTLAGASFILLIKVNIKKRQQKKEKQSN